MMNFQFGLLLMIKALKMNYLILNLENLVEALKTLPEREAMLVQLYYVEELNVYEIAEVLEITTGRVSQIKKVLYQIKRIY